MFSLFYLIHEHFFFAKKKIGSLQTIGSTMADIGPKWVFENIEINNSLSLKRNKNKVFVVKINKNFFFVRSVL